MSDAVVILAAGEGARMKSAHPKVLHPIGNAPMLHHAMRSADALEASVMAVVVGHGAEAVGEAARAFRPDATIIRQTDQLGTGHAVFSARQALSGIDGDLFVLFGDTPFIRSRTLLAMRAARAAADIVALGFEAANPGAYGRFLMSGGTSLEGIVEAGDATPEQLGIARCNSGLMVGDAATMFDLLDRIGNANAQSEYYLTDIVGLAVADGLRCSAVLCDEAETMGVNDRVQLARAEAVFQTRARGRAMAEGATLVAPETVHFSMDTRLGLDVLVHPNVVFGPGVAVGDNCEVKAFTHLEDTILSADVTVGPFARLRGGTELARGVRIGNFVEAKNARLGEGTKAGHLSYLGDAVLGGGVNVGAGTITCNYDGVEKRQTIIDDGAFIGVNTALIAPVRVGEAAYVGTGTVVTEDVPVDALALSRTPQVNRKGMARRLRRVLAARATRKDEAN